MHREDLLTQPRWSPGLPRTPPEWPGLLGIGLGNFCLYIWPVYMSLGMHYLEGNKAIRYWEREQPLQVLLADHKGFLLLLFIISKGWRRRPLISTRSGSTRQKVSRFVEQILLRSSSCSLLFKQDQIYLCERSIDHANKVDKVRNPKTYDYFSINHIGYY